MINLPFWFTVLLARSSVCGKRGLGLFVALDLALFTVETPAEERTLTVSDAIETTRAMIDVRGNAISISPDGTRYLIVLIRGDIERDRVETEFWTGMLHSLRAAEAKNVAALSTAGLGGTSTGERNSAELTSSTLSQRGPVWLDSEQVALLWEDANNVWQVIAINLKTGKVRYLTKHPTDVLRFAMSSQGSLLYDARKQFSTDRSAELLRNGFAVTSPDVISLSNGIVDGSGYKERMRRYERFVSGSEHPVPERIDIPTTSSSGDIPIWAPYFSPDGRFAIVDDPALHVPNEWESYTDEILRVRLKLSRDGIRQLFVVDLEKGATRPLLDAPVEARRVNTVAWSSDGKFVIVGPTFLPLSSADPAARNGQALAQIDVSTGRFWQLPVAPKLVSSQQAVRWISNERLEIEGANGERWILTKAGDRWVGHESSNPPANHESQPSIDTMRVKMELRQDLNEPPKLYAIDRRTGAKRLVLDLNPGLTKKFTLGRAERFQWKDSEGRAWTGRLYYPANYAANRRYPLVIQTNTPAPERVFSLYGGGPDLGPNWGAGYIAQPLANKGFAVLHAGGPVDTGGWWDLGEIGRAKRLIASYEAAAEHLIGAGLVDRGKVGIVGYSNRGWVVEYALTHSRFPYAAAIAVDNKTGGYIQAAALGWKHSLAEELNSEPPFGDGLKAWLEHSPAFNVERVRTPLQLQLTGSLGAPTSRLFWTGWEMFSRLRELNKPVEFFVIPNIARGDHALQNPNQVRAAQQRAVDWFCFWLRGEEDGDSSKVEQYSRWRELRALQSRTPPGNELSTAASLLGMH